MNRIKKCLKYVSKYFSAYSHPAINSIAVKINNRSRFMIL